MLNVKTLHLIRHGKSSWEQPGVADIDRSLLPKGIANSALVAEKLVTRFGKPDIIISSPANRTIHTALIMARTMQFDTGQINIIPSVYESSVSNIIEIVESMPSHFNSIAIVGHNPTFTDLANLFLCERIENIPTSGIVTLQFNIKDWNIIDKAPTAHYLEFPKKDYF